MERDGADRPGTEGLGEFRLVAYDPEGSEHAVRLAPDAERVLIGRGHGNDLVLDWDPEVSRTHAQIERIGHAWTVVDDGISRNGTQVNGERLTGRRRLQDGDVVRVGRTDVLVRAPAFVEPPTVRPDRGIPIELSPGQRRVLIELARPYAAGGFPTPASNQAIAARLVISQDAVKGHLRALFGKFALGALPQNQKRARLVERALEQGVITQHDLR